ncbi:MAG TPA: serine hydrolase [Acidobacteriaceae bacterium]|nr:serine hydrolase [Acidobacteriaceae bacterium]
MPALALLLAVFAAPTVPAQQFDPALAAQLRALIAPFHGKVSVYAHDMATGQTVGIDADQEVPTASVIKLTILYTALEQMRAGRLHFSDPLTLRRQDQVQGSGVLLFFDTPLHLDVKDALTLMINESDNTATNLMIDRLGLKTIDDQIVALGMKNTWLYKKVFEPPVGPMPPDQPLYGLGKTTAREMGGLMERFVTCNLGPAPAVPPGLSVPSDPDLCAAALHMLRLQMDRDGIPRYLESLDATEGQSAVANKTGALDHVRNDVGAVYTPKGVIILSIFTHDNQNTSWTADNPALILIANIAKTVVDAWAPGSLKN